MSQDNLIQSIPLDTYRKILFLLDPEDLSNECSTNKYANNVCSDDHFIRDYIRKHYDPLQYKVGKWDNNVFENPIINHGGNIKIWKDVFKKLISKKFFTLDVYTTYMDYMNEEYRTISNKLFNIPNFPIYFSDTYLDIVNRYTDYFNNSKFLKENYEYYNIKIKALLKGGYIITPKNTPKITITTDDDIPIYYFNNNDIIGTIIISDLHNSYERRFPDIKTDNINLFDSLVGIFGSDSFY